MTLEEMRTQYPSPVTHASVVGHRRFAAGDYGVCGAVCRAAHLDYNGGTWHFPGVSDVARALRALNAALPAEYAASCANVIILCSDAGRFEDARTIVGYALSWRSFWF